jgi:hypothetical protein
VKTTGISRIARLLAIILPVFLFSCEDTVPGQEGGGSSYAFSARGDTLTLFADFALQPDLSGLNKVAIPELATAATAAAVKTLVIRGETGGDHFLNERALWNEALLPGLTGVALPDFTGTVGGFSFAVWLERFEAPLATAIGDTAFLACENLGTVSFPAARKIGDVAFYNCVRLSSVDLPAAEEIGQGAFQHCPELATVDLPVARTIGESAFNSCVRLATIDFPVARTIGSYAFAMCLEPTRVDLPAADTIRYRTFYGCEKLTSVNLPAAVTIQSSVFEGCWELTVVDLPAARSIEKHAFIGFGLNTLKLGHGGEISLSDHVFYQYGALDNLVDHISLYLRENVTPAPVGVTWNGYTWREILTYAR